MKKYLLILFALLCLGLVSCEQQEDTVPVIYGPSVLISNYGLQTDNLLDDADLAQGFPIYVECAGAFDGEVNVSLTTDEAALEAYNQANGTSYRLMPADCYNLDAASKKMTNKQAEFVLTYDVEKIGALAKVYDYSDITDYVIPFAIVSETSGLEVETLDGVNNIFVNPRMTHKIVEKFSLVGPSSDDVTVTEDAFSWSYKLVQEDNKWASGYEFAVSVTDYNDNALVEGADYVLECSSEKEAFEAGGSEITYTLSFPTSTFASLPVDVKLKVKAEIKSVENGFIVDGEGVSNLTFEPYPVLDCSNIPDSQLDWNTWNAGNNNRADTHPRNLFNGKLDGGYWEGHNAVNTPPPGGESYVNDGTTAPFAGINFGKEVYIHSLTVITPRSGNWGVVRAGGFNFDWDQKLFKLSEKEQANVASGQWKYGLGASAPGQNDAYDESKVDICKAALEAQLSEWCDVIFNWDLVHLKKVKRGGRAADNVIGDALYKELHPIVVDRKTQYLQLIALPGWWDFPAWNTRTNGSILDVAELEIRVVEPKLY